MKIARQLLFILLIYVFSASGLQAQDTGRSNALRVYLDCNTRDCDEDLFRTDISFVDWVRDRTLADVHLIITSSSTGGGGAVYVLDFVGLQDLEGDGDELTYTSLSTETSTETRNGLSRVIAVGLARYSTLLGRNHVFAISSVTPPASASTDQLVSEDEVEDPWNFWVFEVGLTTNLSGEETRTESQFEPSFEASRTTEEWNFEFGLEGDFRRDERDRSTGTIVDERTNWSSDASLSYAFRDNWSLGAEARVGSSSSRNEDLSSSAFGIVEYSFYPYADAPRRSFTARYLLGMRYFDWEEQTIYGEVQEAHPEHEFRVRYFQRQPWGNASVTLNLSQYLHDTQFWNARINANTNFRLTQGLSLNIRGDYSLIEDQLFISAGGLTDEEILLGNYDRPTDFEYSLRVGITYEFGSIFNNVVNNRISGGGF
jgi:hypothetical protein